jgi:hypothetical protein
MASTLLAQLPPAQVALAYGSGVFQQEGYSGVGPMPLNMCRHRAAYGLY